MTREIYQENHKNACPSMVYNEELSKLIMAYQYHEIAILKTKKPFVFFDIEWSC